MPSESPEPVTQRLPITHRSELLDVRLISIEGHSPDRPVERADISVAMDDLGYRFEPGFLFVRLATVVRYLEPQEDRQSSGSDSAESGSSPSELARLTVVHVAEVSLEDDPSDITQEQVEDFLGNMLFIMFPFVRASISRYSSDLSLPTTWLPYLRRDLNDSSAGAGGSESGNGLADD